MKTFAAVESQDVHLCTKNQISKLRAVKIPNATFFFKDFTAVFIFLSKSCFLVSVYP